MSEVKKAVPFVYWAHCDDPDYSAVCWYREDALTEINDHGGTLYELSHTRELNWVTAERDAALGREAKLIVNSERGKRKYQKQLQRLQVAVGQRNSYKGQVIALQALLTAADERADTATSLIQRIVANFDTEIEFHEDVAPNDLEHDQVLAEMRVFLAELKPEPSGGDSARLALRPENQRITPARFKCLACGEYHEGSGNLPCPSMSPYSRIEP